MTRDTVYVLSSKGKNKREEKRRKEKQKEKKGKPESLPFVHVSIGLVVVPAIVPLKLTTVISVALGIFRLKNVYCIIAPHIAIPNVPNNPALGPR